MIMHSNGQEESFHRYIHVDALLKHFSSWQRRKSQRAAQPLKETRALIEQSSRSQAGKWRSYAKVEDRGSDCPSRTNVA
jgi:hypothetical protein